MLLISGKGDVFGDSFWRDPEVGQASVNVRALTYCDIHLVRYCTNSSMTTVPESKTVLRINFVSVNWFSFFGTVVIRNEC